MTDTAEQQQPIDMRLSLAKSLVSSLEQGDIEETDKIMNNLLSQHESVLFQEVGKLTRQLHDTVGSFNHDDRITELAQHRIPDAHERLNYVMDKTEESAHRTLSAIEEALPVANELETDGTAMREEWKRFTRREMNVTEFREMSKKIDVFLENIEQDAKFLNGKLSDIMMAQDFQDLTGQIIRQVITLVQDIQDSLVNVIKKSGRVNTDTSMQKDIKAEGPQVNKEDNPDVMSGQDDVDDLLSSLGF